MRSLSSQVGWTKGDLKRHTQQPRDDGTHVQRGLATAAHGTGETEDLDMGCRYGGQTGGASHDDSEWKRDTYRAHLQCAIFPSQSWAGQLCYERLTTCLALPGPLSRQRGALGSAGQRRGRAPEESNRTEELGRKRAWQRSTDERKCWWF